MKNPLCYIHEIYQAINEFEAYFQKDYKLNFNECMALCSLIDKEMISGDLAKDLGISHPNTSKILRSLESKKLVQRTTGQDDRRKMVFSLTEEGKKKIDIQPSDREQLSPMLRNLINYFEQHSGK